MAGVEEDVDRLYGLPRDGFVVARDATARRLRADGRREDAAAIARLRRPTVAAALVNRLVREEPKRMRELGKVASALQKAAQSGDAAALREAVARERELTEELVRAAEALEPDAGQPTLQRVRETLHAAAVDPEARDDVLSGRLERERQAVGFGAFPVGPAPTPSRPEAAPARKAADEPEQPKPAKQAKQATPGRPSAGDRRRERERAAAEAAARRERLDAARAARDEAQAAEREARAALREAEQEVDRLREELDRAEAAYEAARDAHDAARERLDAAEAEVEEARRG